MKDQNKETNLYSSSSRKPESTMHKLRITRRGAISLVGSGGLALITGAIVLTGFSYLTIFR